MSRDSFVGFSMALLLALFVWFLRSPQQPPTEFSNAAPPVEVDQLAPYGSPVIDGKGDDAVWEMSEWLPLDQVWIGKDLSADDFNGRYKLAWDENNLYVLAEITDDTLIDIHPNGLDHYWDDDCLEIFIDEDASGGNHQYNYNAFAYHIALDGKVVDIAPDSSYQYYNDHCLTRRVSTGNTSVWEVAVRVFDGNRYQDGAENVPKMLKSGKVLGFALAYCDNDHSPEREHFIGNVAVAGEDKNRGWIDAGIFGKLGLQ